MQLQRACDGHIAHRSLVTQTHFRTHFLYLAAKLVSGEIDFMVRVRVYLPLKG